MIMFEYSPSAGYDEKFRFRIFSDNFGTSFNFFSKKYRIPSFLPLVRIPNFEPRVENEVIIDGIRFVNFSKNISFVVTDEVENYPGSDEFGLVSIKNDPFQSIDTSIVTSKDAFYSLKNFIGNERVGALRIIEHIGGTISLDKMDNLVSNTTITEIPFFPPQTIDFSKPSRYKITCTDNGYKHYIISPHPDTGVISALESKEMTGQKTIIWDGTDSNFKVSEDISSLTDDDKQALKVQGIETVLNTALQSIHANLGSFKAQENTWEIVNIPGKFKIISDTTSFKIEIYSSDWSNVISSVSILVSDGTVSAKSGTSEIIMFKDGDITINSSGKTIVNSSGDVEITGDVKIVGTLDVS